MMLSKRKQPETLDDYLYLAKDNADLTRQNTLKLAIPLVTVSCLFGYPYLGNLGVGAVGLIAIGYCQKMGHDIRKDWERIDELDRSTIYQFTPPEHRKGMRQALKVNTQHPTINNQQPIPRLPQAQPKSTVSNQPESEQFDSDRIEFDSTQYGWIDQIKPYYALLIYAQQGSGKSTFTHWLASERQKMGDKIICIDPHYKYGDWQGLEVLGKGYNWEEIEQFMVKFAREIKTRYETYANQPNPNFEPITLIVEEITNASDHVNKKVLSRFDGILNGDIRKIKIRVIKVSHGKTLGMTGGKLGTADGRDRQYIQLLLKGKIDSTSDDGISPAFKADLKLPNREIIEVEMNPDWKVEPVREPVREETHEPLRTTGSEAVREVEPVREPVEPVQPLSPEDRDRLISAIDKGWSQNKIASEIFATRKGANERYQNAVQIIQKMKQERSNSYSSWNGIV